MCARSTRVPRDRPRVLRAAKKSEKSCQNPPSHFKALVCSFKKRPTYGCNLNCNHKGREPPVTSKIWVGRGAHRNKSPRGNEVCERYEAKMERNGAKVERNGAKMERNGAKMERNGAKMERKWSETYRPSPLCGTGGMCAGKPFKKCLVTSRPMNLPVTNVTWLLP